MAKKKQAGAELKKKKEFFGPKIDIFKKKQKKKGFFGQKIDQFKKKNDFLGQKNKLGLSKISQTMVQKRAKHFSNWTQNNYLQPILSQFLAKIKSYSQGN